MQFLDWDTILLFPDVAAICDFTKEEICAALEGYAAGKLSTDHMVCYCPLGLCYCLFICMACVALPYRHVYRRTERIE